VAKTDQKSDEKQEKPAEDHKMHMH
jgi:hypothetical protein